MRLILVMLATFVATWAQDPLPPAAPVAALAQNLNGPQVYGLAEGTVYKLVTRLPGTNSEREHGTAFVVRPDGYLVTNYHVVATSLRESDKYELILQHGDKSSVARVLHVDPVNDIAVIQVNETFPKFLQLAPHQGLANGETIFSLGFPKSEQITMINGTFNGERLMGFAPVLAASMPLNPGMSGGPSLNSKGDVIGVNRAMMTQAQNISYLSPWAALAKIVAKVAVGGTDRELASTDWKRKIKTDIMNQETWALARPINIQLSRQKIGNLSFSLPLNNMQCGQDDNNKAGLNKREFIFCQTVSLALLGPETESLQVATVAVRNDSKLALDLAFGALKGKYEKAKRARPAQEVKSRGLASLSEVLSQPEAEQKCSVRNVRNKNGVGLRVRFCAVAIPDFEGLFSTFVKIDVLEAGTGGTTLAQAYEGLSLPATAKMVGAFLDSVNVERDKK